MTLCRIRGCLGPLKHFARTGMTLLATTWLVAACQPGTPAPGAAAAPKPLAPAEVGVVVAAPRAVGLTAELPGRLEA